MKKVIVAYVPVLHRGYEDFFSRHMIDTEALLLFGPETISKFEWLKKDLRCLDPHLTLKAIQAWKVFPKVFFLESLQGWTLFNEAESIIMPDETECRMLAESEFAEYPIVFDKVSLRYDKKKTESLEKINAQEVSDEEAIARMDLLQDLSSKKSPDWWIRVGAMIVRNGEVLLTAWNEHMPSEREALYMGDPRSNYRRGINIELTIVDHAERVLIGEAARDGISLKGADLLVTTFPCPPCAHLVRRAGIKRLFFRYGYAVLDGDALLKEAGIEIFRVKNKPQ